MKQSNQHRMDQVATVTSKSSGLNYERTKLNPSQGEADARKPVTKNDKK